MKNRNVLRFLSAVLCAVTVASCLAAPASARLLKSPDKAGSSSSSEKETGSGGSISVSDLKKVAKGADTYTVDPDFLKAVSKKKSITVSALKKYAVEYQLPAQYVQRFIKDSFVLKAGKNYIYRPVNKNLAKNKYDFSKITSSSREKKYPGAIKGIDVSEFQGQIDWKKVKADGVKFAFIRVGYRGWGTGKLVMDQYFTTNMKNATKAGVDVGVYFYSMAVNTEEAIEEAKLVLKSIKPYDLDYPIVIDLEDAAYNQRTANLSQKQLTDIAIAFCNTISKAGHRPMIYANTTWFTGKLDMSRLTKYDKWLAQYYEVPFFPYKFEILQYSYTGRVDGIKGNVDMNLSFKKY